MAGGKSPAVLGRSGTDVVRQVLGGEHLVLRQRDAALEHVPELADVAGPVVGAEQGKRRLGHAGHALAAAGGRFSHQVVDEQRDVLAPLAQRREVDGHHLQPVVEVLAEASGRDRPPEVAVGGSDDPDVHLPPLRPAHGADLVLLEDAQELGLERRRDVPDLVEEDRAAVRLREQTGRVGHRARERAAHVPEELALEERLGERGAVDRHERPLAAQAVAVDGARDELLARAALARDQDGARARRDAGDGLVDLDHGRRAADHAAELLARLRQLGLRLRPTAEGPADRRAELLDVHRLADVVDRPRGDGQHRRVDRPERGHDHHRHLRPALAQPPEELEPVELRHADVEHRQVDRLLGSPRQGAARVGLPDDGRAVAAQHLGEQPARDRIVVDHEEARRAHDSSIGSRTRTLVPCPRALSTSSCPPCARTMWSTIARPSPVPRPGALVV